MQRLWLWNTKVFADFKYQDVVHVRMPGHSRPQSSCMAHKPAMPGSLAQQITIMVFQMTQKGYALHTDRASS